MNNFTFKPSKIFIIFQKHRTELYQLSFFFWIYPRVINTHFFLLAITITKKALLLGIFKDLYYTFEKV